MYELLRKGIHVQASNRPFHFRSGDIERDGGTVQSWYLRGINRYLPMSFMSYCLNWRKNQNVDIYAATTGLMQDVDLGSPAYMALKLPEGSHSYGRTMGVPDSGEAWFY